ncbi:MAG: S9 family peptidase [Actinomycetota bacterium]|nr:S9 family peptidase [Actinomycetota bacterium]
MVQTSRNTPSAPPIAKKVPVERTVHGDTVVDPYSWLRDREDPDVLAYLEAENAWTEAVLEPTAALRDQLFEEIRSRVQETDLSVPVRRGTWWYQTRTEEGLQYPIFCRRPAAADGSYDTSAADEVMLDQNELAAGHDYCGLGVFDVGPHHRMLAFAVDLDGSERYELRFKDLSTGELLDDVISDVYYGSAWARDQRTFFYTRHDDAMRPHQVWRHVLGTPASDDVCVYTEDDERFFVSVDLTRSEDWVIIHVGSKVTDEVWLLPADDPHTELRVVEPRRQDVEYAVEHHSDRFFIVTNDDGAESFKVVEAPVATPGREHWHDFIPHRPDVKVQAVDAFSDHLIVHERAGGVRRLEVTRLSDGESHVIEVPEQVSTTTSAANPEFFTTTVRFNYQSMITPPSVFEYDLETRERTLLKQRPVLGGYDADTYVTHRIWATASDGAEIPISLVHRRDLTADGTAPALLYGYGSYEASIDPTFSSARLSLLERGWVFAIAHVRGGGELGRPWYTHGKYLHKRNTFTDFVACGTELVSSGWAAPGKLAMRGGSAGGLLVGAVLNLAPDLFGAAIAEVPFVDALNTILDPSLPLTVMEWEEWGNPVASAEFYEYMKSYAPYENVAPRDYPPILATAGLNDPRVSYWEPAKWVARLRDTKTDANPLLLKTEMGAGHGGPSGRYDAWRDEALVLGFLIDTLSPDAERRAPGA